MRICFHLQCFWTISIVWWAYKYSKISFNRKIYQAINILKILFNKYSNLKCNERSTNCEFTFYHNQNWKTKKSSAHLVIYFVFFSLVFSYVHKFKEKKENKHFLRWFYYDFFVFVIVIVVLPMDVTFVLLHLFHAYHCFCSKKKLFCLLM